jgi:cellulose synthase/poly-beta-1,6-N-acetylglucosamine synthase-like glycosyltransferase
MLIESIFATGASLIVYHHLGYPLALRALTARSGRARYQAPRGDRDPPTITVIVPVHNEERFIGAKIRNCASLDYSAASIEFVVVCDGCTDSTAKYAAEAIAGLGAAAGLFRLVVRTVNRGKISVLNEAISNCGSQLVALTDASAALSPDALKRAARAFEDPHGDL